MTTVGLLLVVTTIASCGLRPIYSSRNIAAESGETRAKSITAELRKISVEPIEGRTGQILRTILEQNFAASQVAAAVPAEEEDPGYGLSITIGTTPSYQGRRSIARQTMGF